MGIGRGEEQEEEVDEHLENGPKIPAIIPRLSGMNEKCQVGKYKIPLKEKIWRNKGLWRILNE